MSSQQQQLENQLRRMCDDLDQYLEDTYGDKYPLHPNRPLRGKAARVAYDGLFSTGTKFTLGYGSETGKGYLVDIEIITLSQVKPEDRDEIEQAAISHLRKIIGEYLPTRKLDICKDGRVYKIIGDFSLGVV
ncbi:MAG: hypothetical protein CVV52_07315 [Spirochaetae bacterium HGW-Spirochaetae-8]|nr:MAG: hypothetical protein CVV52_07315 [Spirochaetae bacterium HGW-Spirochaetae-8]